jgi:hypothetical protein
MTGVKRILSKNIGTTDERRQIIMDGICEFVF